MIKTVLVTGDLLQQVDLVPEQVAPYKSGGSLPALTVENPERPGGTLASLVEAACSDLTPRILAAGGQAAAGQSYVLWDLFPQRRRRRTRQVRRPASTACGVSADIWELYSPSRCRTC